MSNYWDNKTPGPGQYEQTSKFNTKNTTAPAYSLRSGRRPLKLDDTPGPGSHDAYSQFV